MFDASKKYTKTQLLALHNDGTLEQNCESVNKCYTEYIDPKSNELKKINNFVYKFDNGFLSVPVNA